MIVKSVNGRWVATEGNLSARGRTEAEARKNLIEILKGHDDLIKQKTEQKWLDIMSLGY